MRVLCLHPDLHVFCFVFPFFETRSHQLDQAALELVISHASASQVLRLQVCTSHWLFLFLSFVLFFNDISSSGFYTVPVNLIFSSLVLRLIHLEVVGLE